MGFLDMGLYPALTTLLASFSRGSPRWPRVLPQWDLSLVLIALTKAPFKPLQLAAPKFLAWKAFFPTLLASGVREVNSMRSLLRVFNTTSGNPSPCFLTQVSSQRLNFAPKGLDLCKSWLSQPSFPTKDWACQRTTLFARSKLLISTWPKWRTSARTRRFSLHLQGWPQRRSP